MFDTTFSGKNGSIHVWFDPADNMYLATVTNDKGSKRVQDTELKHLFSQLREEAGDKLALLSVRKFIGAMGHSLRDLNTQRRNFLKAAKPEFAKIRTQLQSQKGVVKVEGKKAGKKKLVKRKK